MLAKSNQTGWGVNKTAHNTYPCTSTCDIFSFTDKITQKQMNQRYFCCSDLLRCIKFGVISIKACNCDTQYSAKKIQTLSTFVLCYQVLLFSLPWPDAAFRIACSKCLVISQGSRLSLEDPDIGHENDHEPKLTVLGTVHMAKLGSRCSSSGFIHNTSPPYFIVTDEETSLICKKQE